MKFLKWKINEKLVAIIAILCFLIVCLLPLLLIAKYNHPCADDYGYGYDAHVAWRDTHSLAETIKAAVNTARHTYYTWQGTFTSIFFMALTPAVFGEQYYAVVPFLMLGMITFSVLYLAKVLLHDLLKASYANSIILSIVLLFMIIQGIYTPASAFFWYNAAIHYTFMQAVMFFMIGFAIRSVTADKKSINILSCILATICAFCVGGGNYLNALMGIVLLVSLGALWAIFFFVEKKRIQNKESKQNNKYSKVYLLLFPLVMYLCAFIINVIAPGNEVRGTNFVDTPAIIAILRSFISGFKNCGLWMSFFTLALLILALPAICAVVQNTKYRFKYPLLVLLFSFCLFSASFTSCHYGLGGEGLPRTLNNCKMLYHVLLVVNEVYFVGWLQRKWKESKRENKKAMSLSHNAVVYTVATILVAIVFLSCKDKEAYYPSYASAKYIHQGYAALYHAQYLERITILSGSETTVYLNEISPKLNVLYVEDITTDPDDWRNEQYATWHGKAEVILVPVQE